LIVCKAGFASVATADFVMLQWPIQSDLAPPWSKSGHLTFDPVSRLIIFKAGFASVATADFVMLQWPIQSDLAPPGSKPTMTEAMTVAVPYPVGSEFATALEF